MTKTIDNYLQWPLLWDFIITVLLYVTVHFLIVKGWIIMSPTRDTVEAILSSLIGTCVSLAGFLLAALTIIVTFKASLKAKGIGDANDALELIFSSEHYPKIVKVYRDALIELVFVFLLLYVIWLFSEIIPTHLVLIALCGGLLVTGLCLCRSLAILFLTLSLERHKREE